MFYRPFYILRPVVLAVDDNHVLGAADDIDIAARHIAHVAGVEPAVRHAGGGRFGVAIIAGHQRRAGAPDLADGLVGQDVAALVADLAGHVPDRAAAIDDRAVAGRPVGVAPGPRQPGFPDHLAAAASPRAHDACRDRHSAAP